jgi:hypothetical protein
MPSYIPGCEEILFNKFRHAKNLLALSERYVQKYKGGGSSKYKEGLHLRSQEKPVLIKGKQRRITRPRKSI